MSLNGEGSLILKNDGTNPVTLNSDLGELEFAGDETITISHLKTTSGDSSNAPEIKITNSGVVKNLTHEGFLEINFLSGKTLTIQDTFEIPSEKGMKVLGESGTLSIGDKIILTGNLNSLGSLLCSIVISDNWPSLHFWIASSTVSSEGFFSPCLA